MSHFSTALQRIVEGRSPGRGGQALFAKEAAVEPASLSRYVNAESRPDVELLERLCGPLDEAERAALVLAYLRDDVPPCARRLVALGCAAERPDLAADDVRTRLPLALREAFELLETEAERSPVVANAILSTAALMKMRLQ